MTELEIHHCPTCFIEYGAPAAMFEARRKDGGTFYCPNGHHLSYRDCENDRIRRERDSLKQQQAWHEDRVKRAKDEAEHERRRRIAASGQVTRLKNRAAAGVCPCCNRTVKQLAAHMADKHPGFKAEPLDDEKVVQLRPAGAVA